MGPHRSSALLGPNTAGHWKEPRLTWFSAGTAESVTAGLRAPSRGVPESPAPKNAAKLPAIDVMTKMPQTSRATSTTLPAVVTRSARPDRSRPRTRPREGGGDHHSAEQPSMSLFESKQRRQLGSDHGDRKQRAGQPARGLDLGRRATGDAMAAGLQTRQDHQQRDQTQYHHDRHQQPVAQVVVHGPGRAMGMAGSGGNGMAHVADYDVSPLSELVVALVPGLADDETDGKVKRDRVRLSLRPPVGLDTGPKRVRPSHSDPRAKRPGAPSPAQACRRDRGKRNARRQQPVHPRRCVLAGTRRPAGTSGLQRSQAHRYPCCRGQECVVVDRDTR